MNAQRLKDKISEARLTGEEISAALSIDPSTYYRKMSAAGESFTVSQAKILARLLALSNQEAAEIFLE